MYESHGVVIGGGQRLHRPLRRHEEPHGPALLGTAGLGHRGGHRDVVAAGAGLPDRCGHRDLGFAVVSAEDVAGEPAEAGVQRALLLPADGGLGGDAGAVLADLHRLGQAALDVVRFLHGADARDGQRGLGDLPDDLGDFLEHRTSSWQGLPTPGHDVTCDSGPAHDRMGSARHGLVTAARLS